MWNVPRRVGGSLSDSGREGGRKAQNCVSPSMPAYSILERFDAFNGCGGHAYDLQLKTEWIGQRGVDDGLLNLLVQPVVNFSPNH